jgi:hypothetical protein
MTRTRARIAAAIALATLFAVPTERAVGAPRAKTAQHLKKGAVKKRRAKKPAPPPPLEGATYDYAYDAKGTGHLERRWLGRAFVHKKAAELGNKPLPVLVFIHGLNKEKIKYRWMGGGSEGDVRRIVSEMIESGATPPMIVAAPSSIDPATIANAGSAWPAFDLDNFLDRTAKRLDGVATLDTSRVIVAAHSGGGCNIKGGLATAIRARKTPVLAGLSIDTCMLFDLAKALAHAPSTMHVIVTWQSLSWDRELTGFSRYFQRELKNAPPPQPGVLRELYHEKHPGPMPHDAMVGVTLKKYLPRILGGPPQVSDASDAGARGSGG